MTSTPPPEPTAQARSASEPTPAKTTTHHAQPKVAITTPARLATAASIEQVLAAHLPDLTLLATLQECACLNDLDIPAGWAIVLPATGLPASRIALTGALPQGGWEAAETISAFRFTGEITEALLRNQSACTLRAFDADSVTTYSLDVPARAGVAAVRSSGYFTANGRRIWAQYSTFVASTQGVGQGLLLVHVLAIDAARRPSLRFDIDDMTSAVHAAFLKHATELERKMDARNDDEGTL